MASDLPGAPACFFCPYATTLAVLVLIDNALESDDVRDILDVLEAAAVTSGEWSCVSAVHQGAAAVALVATQAQSE